MRVLVVGANGFVGRWLCVHLVESNDEVHAVVGSHYTQPISGVASAVHVDVRDLANLKDAVREASPKAIYFLAGISRRGERDDLGNAAGISVIGAVNTLLAAAGLPTPPRLLYVSTGLVYSPSAAPRSEDDPIAPQGMYATAKYAGEVALGQLGRAAGIDVLVARAFNHVGPGQSGRSWYPPLRARSWGSAGLGRTRFSCRLATRFATSVTSATWFGPIDSW